MRPYEASQAGHGAIEEGTVCDHMSPRAGRTLQRIVPDIIDHRRPYISYQSGSGRVENLMWWRQGLKNRVISSQFGISGAHVCGLIP